MAHYNDTAKRAALIEQAAARGVHLFADTNKHKFCTWLNLCLAPHTWEQTYASVRKQKVLSHVAWECLGGAVLALFVNQNKFNRYTKEVVAEVLPDFVTYIRADKVGDPWKFILSMRRYLPRYITIKALGKAGVDWRELAVECMGAKTKPRSVTYHSLFTNVYVRSLVKAIVVFRLYRSPGDPEYVVGTNDLDTLITQHAASNKCVAEPELYATIASLQSSLPAWNYRVRAHTCFFLSYLLPLYWLTEKQMLPSMERNVLGTTTKEL